MPKDVEARTVAQAARMLTTTMVAEALLTAEIGMVDMSLSTMVLFVA